MINITNEYMFIYRSLEILSKMALRECDDDLIKSFENINNKINNKIQENKKFEFYIENKRIKMFGRVVRFMAGNHKNNTTLNGREFYENLLQILALNIKALDDMVECGNIRKELKNV